MSCTNPILTSLTPQNFKNQFPAPPPRGFNYLPVWVAGTYNAGQVVFYSVNSLFYSCLRDGVTSTPGTTNDWVQIADSVWNYVQDADITRAFVQACTLFNEALWNPDNMAMGYLYLVAHFVVMDWNMNGNDSTGVGRVQSRTVGSISESYVVPEWMNKFVYADYVTTSYGVKYLMMVKPQLIGRTAGIYGGTRA